MSVWVGLQVQALPRKLIPFTDRMPCRSRLSTRVSYCEWLARVFGIAGYLSLGKACLRIVWALFCVLVQEARESRYLDLRPVEADDET